MCFDLTTMSLDLSSMRLIHGQPEKVLYQQGFAEVFGGALLINECRSTNQGEVEASLNGLPKVQRCLDLPPAFVTPLRRLPQFKHS